MPPDDAAVPGAEGDVDEKVRARFFPAQASGVLVEVGAADPAYLSLSSLYRRNGWQVVSVEPNPAFCEAHRAAGHEILQFACGDHDEDAVDFSVVDSHGGEYEGGSVSYEAWSSLKIKDSYAKLATEDLSIRTIKVDLRRLDTLLAEYAPTVEHIDIVSVDVEGWELEVLDGLDTARFKPRVLIIENLFNEKRYQTYMRQRGYVLWRRLSPNDIYVAPSEIGWSDRLTQSVDRVRAGGTWLGATLANRWHRYRKTGPSARGGASR
jgi:FkbM family methyltransferase